MKWNVNAYLNTINWNNRLSRELPAIEKIIEMHESPEPLCILDLGCGPGKHISRLARKFQEHEFHGIDTDEKMIQHARTEELTELKADGYTNAHFHQGNIIQREFNIDIKFDIIYCLGNTLSLMWGMNDIEPVLESIVNYMSPKGHLLFQILNTEQPRKGYSTSKISTSPEGFEMFTIKRFQPNNEHRTMSFEFSVLTKPPHENKFSIETQETCWRLIPFENIINALKKSNVKIISCWDSYDTSPFIPEKSKNLIVLGIYKER
ncbi:MAG: class I SAM-dependent methyltransferase [Promethearchaeota archaeon]